CDDCGLREGATQPVPGCGALDAPLMMVGEAPGAEEDRCGIPFSGPAGQLLDRSLSKIGVRRSRVYITNVVRYRPPENRMPRTGEIAACVTHLLAEIRIIRPRIIAALGAVAAQTLLGTKDSLRSLRGKYVDAGGFRVFPMVHPAFALRNLERDPSVLASFETDLRRVCADAGLP
ncbi:MAG: uracil-DNA glycosylase, partial [Planctomycetaceae bacterium]|nr:uracil-DNA glycosylase [Planctomycetaceae bacterium]